MKKTEQLSLFQDEKNAGCGDCKFYSELKTPRERSDGAVIYGYCFRGGDTNHSLNMGKGYAVFLPEGYCKKKARQR